MKEQTLLESDEGFFYTVENLRCYTFMLLLKMEAEDKTKPLSIYLTSLCANADLRIFQAIPAHALQ